MKDNLHMKFVWLLNSGKISALSEVSNISNNKPCAGLNWSYRRFHFHHYFLQEWTDVEGYLVAYFEVEIAHFWSSQLLP